jgi:hypothetical protein
MRGLRSAYQEGLDSSVSGFCFSTYAKGQLMVSRERMNVQYRMQSLSRGSDVILSIDQIKLFVISQKSKSEGTIRRTERPRRNYL